MCVIIYRDIVCTVFGYMAAMQHFHPPTAVFAINKI